MSNPTPFRLIGWKLYTPTKEEIKREVKDKHLVGSHMPNRIIYCYGRRAFIDGFSDIGVWTKTLQNTRGICFDEKGNMLARGIPKLFNLGENALTQWNPDWEGKFIVVLEKFNGFGCNIWQDPIHGLRFTTKAGQGHDFERFGKELNERKLLKGFDPIFTGFQKDFTYITEGIHEEDPHTIPYDPGLYLIGFISHQLNTFIIDLDNYPGEVFLCHNEAQIREKVASCKKEGYVAYVCDSMGNIEAAFKIKSEEYLKKREAKEMVKNGAKKASKLLAMELDENGDAIYNPSPVMDALGELYDDWYSQSWPLIRDIESRVNQRLTKAWVYATEDPRPRRELAEHLISSEKALMPVVMALLDGKEDAAIKHINSKWVQEFLDEEA